MSKRLSVALSLFFIVFAASAVAANNTGPALLATAPAHVDGSVDGVATFGGVIPSAAQLDALRALGLRVQGLDSLPLALMRGPRAAMFDAVGRGLARDVYPNERLRFYSA